MRIAFVGWVAAFCAAWLAIYHPSPVDLVESTRQYLTWSSFSPRTLGGNWAGFARALLIVFGLLAAGMRLGRATAGWLGCDGRDGRGRSLLVAACLGLGILGVATLGVGFVGLLYPPPRWATVLLAIMFLGPGGIVPWGGIVRGLGKAATGTTVLERVLLGSIVVLVAASLMNTEMTWDALMYHMRVPSFFQYRHKVYDVWHHFYSVYPAHMESLFLLARLADGDMAVRALWGATGLLLLLSVRGLARDCGVAEGPVALLVGGSPMVLILMTRSYVDVALALAATMAAREWLAWLRTGSVPAAIRSGVFAGIAMGTKYVGVLLVPGLVLAAVTALPRTRRAPAWAGWVCACAAFAGPWLVRNWIFKGNPTVPFLGPLFGVPGEIPPEVVPVPWIPLIRSGDAGGWLRVLRSLILGDGGAGGPYHPLFVAFAPLLIVRRPAPRLLPLRRFFLGYFAAWLLLCPDIRFLLPAMPVLAVLLADAMGASAEAWGSRWAAAMRASVCACAALGVAYAASFVWIQYDPLSLPLGFETAQQKIRRTLYPVPFHGYLADYVNAQLPPGARVMYLSHFNSYYVERECVCDLPFGRAHLVRMVREEPTAAGMAKRLRQLGIGWLVSTGTLALEYGEPAGFTAISESGWEEFKRLLVTRAEVQWQTDGLTLYRLGRTHSPRPIPSLPILEALIFAEADRALAQGRAQEALTSFLRPPPPLADVGSTFLRQAEAYAMLKDNSGAESAFSRALGRGLDTPGLRAGLAATLLRMGRPRVALPHAELAWARNPISAHCVAILAAVHAALGNRERALELIRVAIRLRPDRREYAEMARAWGGR